jgi:hypothetical protein
VAKTLEGATLDEVYRLGTKATGETQKALKDKYGHLNDGMQRMNLGNRIRGHINKLNGTDEGSGDGFLETEGSFIRDAVAKRQKAAAQAKKAS